MVNAPVKDDFKHIKEYRLLWSNSEKDLTSDVNGLLEQGWSLYGDPMMAADDRFNHYAQAMVLLGE